MQIILNTLASGINHPKVRELLLEHETTMKTILRFLENSRTQLKRRRSMKWKNHDNFQNLGLLLILLGRAKTLPRKPYANINKILNHTENRIWVQEPDKNAVVYYCFSTATNNDYVGQTTAFTVRKRREIWDARRYTNLLRMKRTHSSLKARRVERIMGTAGYRTWYHWPIRILGMHTTLRNRLSNERQVVRWLQPTLNDGASMWSKRKRRKIAHQRKKLTLSRESGKQPNRL